MILVNKLLGLWPLLTQYNSTHALHFVSIITVSDDCGYYVCVCVCVCACVCVCVRVRVRV